MATSNTDKILSSIFTTDSSNAIALHVYLTDEADSNIAKLPEAQQAWLKQISFSVEPGNAAVVPGDEGPVAIAVVDEEPLESLASLVSKLPVATYHLVEFPHAMDSMAMKLAALGWGMDQYRFEHYLSAPRQEYRQDRKSVV